MLETIMMMF